LLTVKIIALLLGIIHVDHFLGEIIKVAGKSILFPIYTRYHIFGL